MGDLTGGKSGYFCGDVAFDDDEVVLQYDDTFEGFMTAIFESYIVKPLAKSVVGSQFQSSLLTQARFVETDNEKAERAISGICKRMGSWGFSMVWLGFISETHGKDDAIYRFIRLGMRTGYSIVNQLALGEVQKITDIVNKVNLEQARMIELVRFSKTAEGVYYSSIEPSCNITPLIMPFFVDRFRTMPFIIHDPLRKVAGISDMKRWAMVDAEGFVPPDLSEDERYVKNLWKCFYDTIAIKERINHKLRMQHMPKKYWKNITEMTMVQEDLDYSNWFENKESNQINRKKSTLNIEADELLDKKRTV